MKAEIQQVNFSKRLRAWRGKLFQKEVAHILGVSTACIRKWEAGKRTPNKLAMAEIERRMIAWDEDFIKK